jgi:hypothetical protein
MAAAAHSKDRIVQGKVEVTGCAGVRGCHKCDGNSKAAACGMYRKTSIEA